MSTNSNPLRPTSREFNSISADLLSSITNMTKEWVPGDETDPGIVYLKLAAMLGDMLSYNRDRALATVFPDTVIERADAYRLFKSLGYKMHWYQSATSLTKIAWTGNDTRNIILPRYTVFQTKDKKIPYTYVGDQVEIQPASLTDITTTIKSKLVQGVPVTPPIVSATKASVSPNPWHSVYSYNVATSDIVQDVFIRLGDVKVAEDSIVLIDDKGVEWKQTDSLASIENGKYYELVINSYNNPYIKLAGIPSSFNVSKFKLFYIRTDGKNGRILANTLSNKPITPVYVKDIYNSYIETYDGLSVANDTSDGGCDYETAEEARDKYERYGSDTQTLVTVDDFKRTIEKDDSVDNCGVYDIENQGEVYTVFMFKKDSSWNGLREFTVDLKKEFGLSSGLDGVWHSSIRIYEDNDLLFSGVTQKLEEATHAPKTYVVPANQEWTSSTTNPPKTEVEFNSGLGDDRKLTIYCHDDDFKVDKQYWIEFRIYRTTEQVAININKNKDYTEEEVKINVNKLLNNKKHVFLNTNIVFRPYKIKWKPKGQIILNRNVTYSEANQLMTNIDIVLAEKFKASNLDLNETVDSVKLKNLIMQYCSDVYNIFDPNVEGELYTYSSVEDETKQYGQFSPIISSRNYQSKKISLYGTISPNARGGSETGPYEYDINFKDLYVKGESVQTTQPTIFTIKPGTLTISINHGEIVMQDVLVNFDEDSQVVTEVSESGSQNKNNYGLLVSDSVYFVGGSNSFVLYDTAGKKAQLGVSSHIDAENICNIMFKLTEDTLPTAKSVQISFETDRDFIFEYDGYDSSKFYIHPECINQNGGGTLL